MAPESDVDLSARGRRQAEAVAGVIAAYRPQRLVSSAMLRARATAAPIARACDLTLHLEPALHERRVGELSGTPTGTREGIWPETLRRWLAGDTSYAPTGAESFDQIRDRVLPVWHRLTAECAGQTLVIVAHGVVCKVLLLTLLPGWSAANWLRLGPIHNVAITELISAPLSPKGTGEKDRDLVATSAAWQALRLNEVPPAVRAVG